MPTRSKPIRLADGLSMPLDALTETLGIFGQKGSGKSSTSAVFVEQGVAAGGRYVIADPTGVWWGLMHDGVGPGLPGIVFGGEHADVPLEATAGHIVAEFVVEQHEYPVVVLDMKLMRKADRVHFMLAFMETLYHENREALHVVLDESPQFAPTQAREGGDQIKLLGAVEDVVGLGRARGLGITMIAQRIAMLNANVREQIGTLVAHRLVGSLDRKALKGWIEAQADPAREKEVMEAMAKLKTAQALVWSPAFLSYFGVVNMNAPVTFDSRATPKVGQRVKKPGKRAAVDLAVLRERMAATIEEAKANDPKELKRMNMDLERKLAEAQGTIDRLERAAATVEARVERVVQEVQVPVFKEGEIEALGKLAGTLSSVGTDLAEAAKSINAAVERAAATVVERVRAAERVEQQVRRPDPPVPARPTLSPDAVGKARAQRAESGGVPAPQQKILDALGWYEALGVYAPTRVQVALIAGYSHSSGGFANLLGKLSTGGLVTYPSPGAVTLTADGRVLATDPGLPSTNEGVQAEILRRLPAPQAKLLEILIGKYPNAMTREELAKAAAYSPTSGGFANLLGKLRTGALIDYPDRGHVVALGVLFPIR